MEALETLLRGLPQAVASGLVYGSIYALIAQGYYVTFSTTQTLNFAQGDFLMMGGMLAFTVFGVLLVSGAPLVVLMVNVADCAVLLVRFTDDGLMVALTPAGNTPRLKSTWPVKPPDGVTSRL